LSWLDESMDRTTAVPAGSTIGVFDRHTRVLARVTKAAGGARIHEPPAAVVQAALSSPGEGIAEGTDSESHVYAHAPLYGTSPPEHLYMTVAIPRAAATAGADPALRQTASAFIFASLRARSRTCRAAAW
jgi:hypothetical protein